MSRRNSRSRGFDLFGQRDGVFEGVVGGLADGGDEDAQAEGVPAVFGHDGDFGGGLVVFLVGEGAAGGGGGGSCGRGGGSGGADSAAAADQAGDVGAEVGEGGGDGRYLDRRG